MHEFMASFGLRHAQVIEMERPVAHLAKSGGRCENRPQNKDVRPSTLDLFRTVSPYVFVI